MKIFHRQAGINQIETDESSGLVVDAAISSPEPYARWWGIEILSHQQGSINLNRLQDGANVLYNHDWNDLRGVVEENSAKIGKDGKLRARLRITNATERGRETINLIQDRILSKISVGYSIDDVQEIVTDKSGEQIVRAVDASLFDNAIRAATQGKDKGDLAAFHRMIDERTFAIDRKKDEASTFLVTKWTPHEVSLVTIPADTSVGIGRSAIEEKAEVIQIPAEPAITRSKTMSEANVAVAQAGASADIQVLASRSAVEMEGDRKAAIDNLCKANHIDDGIKNLWITSGASVKQVSEELMRILEERGKHSKPVSYLGLSPRETQQFSFSRAILAVQEKNWNNAGFEAEASRAIAQKMGRSPDPHKFFVPWEVQDQGMPVPQRDAQYSLQKRDLTVATAGAGGYLVETANVGFIELLRARSVIYQMGAQRLSGLVGSVAIPKQSVAGTAVWLANEASTITESNQTFVQVTLSPKSVGGYTEISRQLLLQSSPAIEGLVRADLAAVVATAIDQKALNGAGSGGEPQGLIGTSGVGSVTGTSLDYADIIEFQTDVFAGNALFADSGFLATAVVAGLLKARVRFTSTASPIWDGRLDGAIVDGYRAMASNNVPTGDLIFGSFSQMTIGEWGTLEVEVNPYANFQAGIVGVRAIATIDVAIRYPSAFSIATSVT